MKLRIMFLLAATFLVCGCVGCNETPQNEQVIIPPAKSDMVKTRPAPQGSETRAGDESK